MRRIAIASAAVVAAFACVASPGAARTRRPQPAAAADPRAAAASRFYPEEIEGGVKGNLSFNNQIRKHTDPLNANGGK